MKFFKQLWQRFFKSKKEPHDPFEPLREYCCPSCFTTCSKQSVYATSQTTVSRYESEDTWTYVCGTCLNISHCKIVDGRVKFLHISTPGGTSINFVREKVHAHFRNWLPVKNTPESKLAYAVERLMHVKESLNTHSNWKTHTYADNGYCANAVDLIIYAMMLSGNHDLCEALYKIKMDSSTRALENYMREDKAAYNTLALRATRIIEDLRKAEKAAQSVPYVFVEPAVNSACSELFKVGLLLLQRKQINHFHTHVFERLHHFVFMSA